MSGLGLDERLCRAVFEHAVDGVVIGRADGSIISADPSALRMFAATEDQLRVSGRHGISNPDDPAWRALLSERAAVGQAVGVVPMFRLDDSTLVAEVSSALLEGPGGEQWTCSIIRDVTKRVRAERRLAAFEEITAALLAGRDTGQVLEVLARHACRIFDAGYATVAVPAAGGGMSVVAAHGAGTAEMLGRAYPPGGIPETVMRKGEPLLVDDVTAVTRSPEVRALGAGPAMVAPLGSGEEMLGALFIAAPPSRAAYDRGDLEEAVRYAARAGVIMAVGHTRAETETDLRRTTEQLKQALESRVLIEQAKGYLACLRHVTPDEAFQALRRYARNHSTEIHTVARMVLERKLVV